MEQCFLGRRSVPCGSKYFVLLWLISVELLQSTLSEYPTYCSLEEGQACGPGKVCLESQCVCNAAAGLVYSDEYDDCNLLAGRKCGFGDEDFDCVPNSICRNDTGVCECETDFVTDGEGECKRGYLSKCDEELLCNVFAFLNCDPIDNTCKCAEGSTMVYDQAQSSCVSTIGNQCELVPWMEIQKKCVSHGICFSDDSMEDANFFGVCICKAGYSPDVYNKGKCGVELYGDCEDHIECATHFCSDKESGNRYCDCPPYSTYDSSSKSCRIKMGESCGNYSKAENSSTICQSSYSSNCKPLLKEDVDLYPFPCAVNSYCDDKSGSCVCIEDYVSEDGICVLPLSTLSPRAKKSSGGGCFSSMLLILMSAMGSIYLLES